MSTKDTPPVSSNTPLPETSSLNQEIAARRARRIATAPESFRRLLTQAMAGQCSPRQAIKAHCAECVGFDRDAITTCTAYACPLWHFRPYQNTTKANPRSPVNETPTQRDDVES